MGLDRERLNGLDLLLSESLRNSKIPGIAIGIIDQDELIATKFIGLADRIGHRAIDGDTVFRMASISKLFTTLGLMQLWEKGAFDLDDPVNKYLTQGRIIPKNPQWPTVTFRHLLTHRSGIGELAFKSDFFKPGFGLNIKWPKPVPPLSALHNRDVKTDVPAGQKYAYSNFGFSLLGYLIERFSGEEFMSYMHKHILDPLKMIHSDFIHSEVIRTTEAQGYVYNRFGYHQLHIGKILSNLLEVCIPLLMIWQNL